MILKSHHSPAVSVMQPPIIHPLGLGQLVFQLFENMAPLAAAHFAVGVDRFEHKDTIFHHDFIIQGGDVNHEYGFGGRSLCMFSLTGNIGNPYHKETKKKQTKQNKSSFTAFCTTISYFTCSEGGI